MIVQMCVISDIHFKDEESKKNIHERVETFGSAIASCISKNTVDLLFVVNGDIAYFGLQKEFDMMREFISKLEVYLLINFPYLQVKYIFVPGNHDCDFNVYIDEKLREELMSCIGDSRERKTKEKEYIKKLDNFNKFRKELPSIDATVENNFFTRYDINNGGHTISLLTFNSVIYFDCKYHSDRMIIDENVFDDIGDIKNSVVLSFTHYPMEWYEREEDNFYNYLLDKSDVVFMSHEHKNGIKTIEKDDHSVIDLRIPAFYTDKYKNKSGFYFINIDSNTTAFSIKEYYLEGSMYLKSLKDIKKNIKRTFRSNTAITTIDKAKYTSFIMDNYILLNNQNIIIDEIFVSPSIGIPYVDEEGYDYYEYIDFEQFNQYENSRTTIFIYGDSYGKTTLLKHLFGQAYNDGYLPIYLKIDSTNNTMDRFHKTIYGFVDDFYGNRDIYEQNKQKTILYVDQFSFFKQNSAKFLTEIYNEGFKKIVLVFDEKESKFDSIEWDYSIIEYYKVNKFGHSQKYDLIDKWIDISKFKDIDVVEKNQKIAEIKKILDNSDSRVNFINTPGMILIFLDAYQDNRADSLLINGSKGVFYKFLFNKYILNLATKSNVEMTLVERFLEAYAYKCFKNETQSFTEFSDEFISYNMISPEYYYESVKSIKKNLKNLHLSLDDKHGDIEFTYKHFQSYLIAQYYISRFDEKESEIHDLTKSLYDDDIANIILFIVHLNRNKKIIEKIAELARQLFKEFKEVECNSDIDIMNEFIKGIKDVNAFGEVKKNNITLNKKLDKIENDLKVKTKKQKIREKTEFEKKNLTSNRLRDIINEILSQMVGKELTVPLIQESIKMQFRRSKGLIKFFGEFITFGKSKAGEFSEEDLMLFNENIKLSVVGFAASIYDISENISPSRYNEFVVSYIKNAYDTNIGTLICNLIDLKIHRNDNSTDYFDKLFSFRDTMLKEKNYICAVLINYAISNELNYIDMKYDKKRSLIDKISAGKLIKNATNPKENLNQIEHNKKIRRENIRTKREKD